MRILLSKKSRELLFNKLKEEYNVKNLKELSKNIKVPFKTLQKWRYGELYLPDKIIGSKKSSLNLIKKLGKEKYSQVMKNRGKKIKNTIWKRYKKEEVLSLIKLGKLRKREEMCKSLELSHESFFTNNKIALDTSKVNWSRVDKKKELILPEKMSKELAEEIGIHLGDGCLSLGKNYFSAKGTNLEVEYYQNYIKSLYKKLYNLNLNVKQFDSVSGFEIYSKGLFEFKNKVLGIPYGEKVERIEIPKEILDSKNKEIYRACIRGIFDTDGCIYLSKEDTYTVLSITIKSKKLIDQLEDMLKKLGFLPTKYKWSLYLNGVILLKKWVNEINSNNPIKKEQLEEAIKVVDL